MSRERVGGGEDGVGRQTVVVEPTKGVVYVEIKF